MKSSKWVRKKILARDIHENDLELSRVLWETTMAERDKGYLSGPFEDEGQVAEHVGSSQFVCSRRFAIIQGGEPRVIDDLEESGINSAFTIVDKLSLHDIDFVASMITFVSKTIWHPDGSVHVKLQDGRSLEGDYHRDFACAQPWSGKCLDLAKAYKQIPISSESRPLGVLVLHRPDTHKPVYFITQSLPFGACASVYAFNRISRGLWFLAAKVCHLILGCFYDDCPMVEPEVSASLAAQSVHHLLKCLGWQYSCDADKDKPFGPIFDVLGVRVNVAWLHFGSFSMANKDSRIEKVKGLVSSIVLARKIERKQAQIIHGLLNFMSSFVIGQSLKILCRAFATAISSSVSWNRDRVVELGQYTLHVLDQIQPRNIDATGRLEPFVIFTDAAFATWGRVALDPVSNTRRVCGGKVPCNLVEGWQRLGGQQIITQAEAFAVLLARKAYAKLLYGRRSLFFVDNEGARYAFIKGISPSLPLLKVVQLFFLAGEHDKSLSWLERVPSH